MSRIGKHPVAIPGGVDIAVDCAIQNLALIGSLGWLVVVPTLLGIYVGRRLDGAQGTGLLWTGALLLAGLTLGCWLAWKRVHEA